jgi:predicted DCC family thiol-disulfide oxidoreductase YuxK
VSHSILYDADCGFCRWSLAWVMRWDRRRCLRPVALQDAEGERLLPGMGEEERMASWHLVTPDGRIHSAGAAAAPLLRLLPAGRPLASVADAFPRLTERLYRWVADHRTLLARPIRPSGLRRADELIARRSAPV